MKNRCSSFFFPCSSSGITWKLWDVKECSTYQNDCCMVRDACKLQLVIVHHWSVTRKPLGTCNSTTHQTTLILLSKPFMFKAVTTYDSIHTLLLVSFVCKYNNTASYALWDAIQNTHLHYYGVLVSTIYTQIRMNITIEHMLQRAFLIAKHALDCTEHDRSRYGISQWKQKSFSFVD